MSGNLRGWGILIALSSGVINGVAYTVQRRELTNGGNYIKNVRWWIGFVLLIVAEILGGISFVMIPASVVVALGATSVVANTILARVVSKEPFQTWVLVGTGCIVVASVCIAAITPAASVVTTVAEYTTRLTSVQSLVYQSLVVVLGLVAQLSIRRLNIVGLAIYAAATSSITVIWFRPIISILISAPDESAFSTYLPYASLALVVSTGMLSAGYIEPKGLIRFLQSEWVPVHFVACFVFVGVAGFVVYDDWGRAERPVVSVIVVVICIVLICWGLFLITGADRWTSKTDSRVTLGNVL